MSYKYPNGSRGAALRTAPHPESKAALIIKEHATGIVNTEIACKVKCSRPLVSQVLKRYNLTPNPPPKKIVAATPRHIQTANGK